MNLRTTFTKIVARAGCKPWPRLFQNLRASCETDWVEKHPAHECAAWLGHSPAIAAAHYLQARNHHFEAVVNAGRKSDAESDAATAQNATQQAPARHRKESQDGIETDRSSRVITVLPNKIEDMYKRKVGLLGLEPRTNGLKVRCSNQLSYSPRKNPEQIQPGHTFCIEVLSPTYPDRSREPEAVVENARERT